MLHKLLWVMLEHEYLENSDLRESHDRKTCISWSVLTASQQAPGKFTVRLPPGCDHILVTWKYQREQSDYLGRSITKMRLVESPVATYLRTKWWWCSGVLPDAVKFDVTGMSVIKISQLQAYNQQYVFLDSDREWSSARPDSFFQRLVSDQALKLRLKAIS